MYKARQSAKRFVSSISYSRVGEQPDIAPKPLKTTSKTSCGITVTTLDEMGPVGSVAVYMNAGSRNELPTTPGVSHLISTSFFRTIPGDNIVRTFRDAELRGNSLYSSSGREHILLGSEFLRDDVVDAVPTLISNAFNKSFQVFEMVKALEFTDEQSSTYLATPQVRVNEELHRVAFRKGLGQASIASNEALNGLKRSDLAEFVQNHFTKDRIAVVATGVNHDELVDLVETSFDGIELKGSSEKPPTTKYYGGESRIDAGPNSTALFSVAFEGSSTSPSDYYTSLVLAELLNSNSGVKYSCFSKIGTESTTVTGFSTSYSDSGLVGFTVKGLNSEVKQVAQNAINELKGATAISSNAFESAKKAAIISFETNSTRSNILESLGKESTSSFVFGVEGFEKVTVDGLKQFAKRIISKKPSIVAFGNLNELPYADDFTF